MGGREVGGLANLLSAHRDLANPVHRAEVAALWGVPDVPARRARPRSRCSRPPPTARSRRCGSPAPTPRSRACPTRPLVRARCSAAEFVVLQEAYATPPPRLRRPAAAGHQLGREGRHRHQQRAPHQPRARRRAAARPGARTTGASPSTWRSGSRRGCARARGPAARCSPTDDSAESSVERAPRDHARPRPRHHRPELGRAGRRGPQQWPCPKAHRRPRACTTDGRFATPDGRARFVAPPRGRWPSRATRASPCR
jgi:assimilatory nitrate reductase catalytic subunit